MPKWPSPCAFLMRSCCSSVIAMLGVELMRLTTFVGTGDPLGCGVFGFSCGMPQVDGYIRESASAKPFSLPGMCLTLKS